MKKISGKRFFIYETPRFGTKNFRKSPSGWVGSPYYWWWEYLRRNEEYKKSCLSNGNGKLSSLYKDWGNIHERSFKEWWSKDQQGAWLFSEKTPPKKIELITKQEQFDQYHDIDSVLMLALPLNETKAQLKVSLNEILRKFHKGRQGNSLKTSSAKYVLSSVPDTGSLATTLAVYDEWIASKKSGQKITKAQIGINMRLVKEYIPLSTDRPAEVTSKKNKMSAMVSRYISNAEAIISNTVLGKFPDNSRPKAAKELSHVNAPKMDIYRYWLKRKVEDPKISMADIGFELKLKESWIPNKNDTAEIIKIKRNKMNSTVSRYIKNAKSFQDNKEHAKQA